MPSSEDGEAVPYSGVIALGKGNQVPVWLGPTDASTWWNSLKKHEFDATKFDAAKYAAKAWPSLPNEWRHLHEGMKDGKISVVGDLAGTEALFALRHDREKLYFDFLIKGMKFSQSHSGSGPVWDGTCTELALALTPEKRLFEASFTLTPDGPEAYWRIAKGDESAIGSDFGMATADSLRMTLTQNRQLLAASAVIDMSEALGEFAGSEMLASIIFRTEPGKMFEVFSGISSSKNPALYGNLKMR